MNAFQNFVWVFRPDRIENLKGKVEGLIEAGYAFATKTHDGNPSDDGAYFWDNYHMMDTIIGQRVPHYAWGYNYGDKFGSLDEEIKGAVASVNLADGYIFDPEIEFETKGAGLWVEKMVQAVISAAGNRPVGYAPFWNRRYHGGYPYEAFDKFGIVAMPQVYYDLGQKTTTKSRTEMFRISQEDFPGNFMPVSGTTSVEGMMHFQKHVNEAGVSHSIWCLDTMPQEQIDYLVMLQKIRAFDEAFGNYKKVFDALQAIKNLI